ncbi:MAG TPA: T9SS type A sorting domain-containing protein [candidate division WOR-3 bacterium]|uniref:T9SS type A sorting domain-containing protein n=1 Tax=candidate division WOR-3 bacterium TaxID=2052148 RepID=A0A9C9EKX7_UNCW3|nr:T9SS type A sorting domain-containing protein [candidate division WOR-3 bacterium]
MKFSMINEGSSTLSDLYAAIFVDWDIGNYSNNQGSSEAARNLTWMYETTPYVGVAILDPPRSTPAANLALIDHDLYVYPNSGLPDSIQIKFMDGTIQNPSSNRAYDWSTCNSAGPFTLAPGGSAVAAFAIVGGDNLADLQANADTAYNRYWNWPGVQERPVDTKTDNFDVRIYPVVSKNTPYTLHYTLPGESRLQVKIYDAAGRLIIEKDYGRLKGMGKVSFDLKSCAQGVYFVKIYTTDNEKVLKVVVLK